jgi:enoyl-CoA hydratase/carnithine racemase
VRRYRHRRRDARFGQPEINLGIIPGAGGTQRLLRAVGKPLAMQMVLSGEAIDARHALQAGLVSEVTEPELTVERALQVACAIAAKAPLAVRLAKEALLKAQDTDLASGLRSSATLSPCWPAPPTATKASAPSRKNARPASSASDPFLH